MSDVDRYRVLQCLPGGRAIRVACHYTHSLEDIEGLFEMIALVQGKWFEDQKATGGTFTRTGKKRANIDL